MSDARIVLVKPGDFLFIGNLGHADPEDIQAAVPLLTEIKERLGLGGVVLFADDIDLAAVDPHELVAAVAEGQAAAGSAHAG